MPVPKCESIDRIQKEKNTTTSKHRLTMSLMSLFLINSAVICGTIDTYGGGHLMDHDSIDK